MKRYALFAGDTYYPSGGMNDFIKFSDDIEELKKFADDPEDEGSAWPRFDWAHIVDMNTWEIVHQRDGYAPLDQIEWIKPEGHIG